MKNTKVLGLILILCCVAAWLTAYPVQLGSQQDAGIPIDNDDIGGVVTSAKGPEAGVWVIAETNDLPTRFARMVVTDDQGRYVIPESAQSQLRHLGARLRIGGFTESEKRSRQASQPQSGGGAKRSRGSAILSGNLLVFHARRFLKPDEFGGKGEIPAKLTQTEWLNTMKNNGCIGCHQLGQLSTRTFPKSVPHPIGTWGRPKNRGSAASSPVNPASKCSTLWSSKWAARRFAISPTGRTGSPRASYRRQNLSGPQGSRAQYCRHDLGLAQRKKISA